MEAVEHTPIDDIDWRTRSATRITILKALSTESRDSDELHALTDVSQVTCDQLLEDAEEKDWIRQDGTQYQVTLIGELMAAHLTALLESFETVSRDRTMLEGYSERISGLEAAIDDLEQRETDQNSRITRIEQRFKGKAEYEDVERMQEAIEEHSEQWRNAREQTNEMSQTLEDVGERLDQVEKQLRTTRTALTEAEKQNEELRTELANVREMAEYAAEHTNRGWIDRLSGD